MKGHLVIALVLLALYPVGAQEEVFLWPASLDTGRDAEYLTEDEKAVLLEMNMVRYNGAAYARLYLQPMLANFNGNFYALPGESSMYTHEGARAVRECIAALNKIANREPLLPARGLALAARDHVRDTGPSGRTGHTGSNGSTPSKRINRYGQWGKTCGENISYGYSGARDIMIQLLVDDGVSSREHRNNILKQAYRYVGLSIGPHKTYEFMCVIDYAGDYTSNDSPEAP
ncbi:lipoprotein [Spirochaetia bacterium]|nr:lipoprotein [Spirochaetia bacterium]